MSNTEFMIKVEDRVYFSVLDSLTTAFTTGLLYRVRVKVHERGNDTVEDTGRYRV